MKTVELTIHTGRRRGVFDITRDCAEFVAGEGDGWTGAMEELQRYYEETAPLAIPPDALADIARPLLELAGAPPSRHARSVYSWGQPCSFLCSAIQSF